MRSLFFSQANRSFMYSLRFRSIRGDPLIQYNQLLSCCFFLTYRLYETGRMQSNNTQYRYISGTPVSIVGFETILINTPLFPNPYYSFCLILNHEFSPDEYGHIQYSFSNVTA